MTTPGKLLPVAALAGAVLASGCIYQRETVREPPPVAQTPPPPPPAYRTPPPADDDSGGPPPPSAQADADVPTAGTDVRDEQVFYDRLAPYGHWEYVPDYGRVWVPAVAPGWRPYVYGRWELTEWGWTWVSDDPWAWAAYHYGYWGFNVGVGWFWIPGRVWAPAWVTWRWGPGWCAWAPIGPRGFIGFGFRHPGWVAVRAEHFTQPIAVHVVAVQQTSVVVRQTSPLSGARAVPSRSGAFGPPVAQVASATGQTIRPVSARSVVGPRPQWARSREVTASAGSRTSATQSPMRSPRAQPGQTRRNWSQTATGGARNRTWGGAPRAGGGGRWGAAAPGAGAARPTTPPAEAGRSSSTPRATPSAPRAAPAPSGGGGGHSGGARGGHGRR